MAHSYREHVPLKPDPFCCPKWPHQKHSSISTMKVGKGFRMRHHHRAARETMWKGPAFMQCYIGWNRINWQGKIQERKAIIWGKVASFEYLNWKAWNKNKRRRQKWTMSFPISPECGTVQQARVERSFTAAWHFRWVGTDEDTGLTAWLPALQYLVFWITRSETDFWMFTFQTAVPFWGLSLMGPVRFSSPFSPFAPQGIIVV